MMGIGDDIMATGEFRHLGEIGHKILPILEGKPTWSPMWDNIPWMVKYDGIPTEVKPNGKRWYVQSWTDHIEYTDWKCTPGVLRFTEAEMAVAQSRVPREPFCIINPDFKSTTTANNKDWGWDNWQRLTNLLSEVMTVVHLVPPVNYVDVSGLVKVSNKRLGNAVPIETNTPREAFAILDFADFFVSSEGGLHHAAGALWKRGVVIFGGFISPHSTGYSRHINIADSGPPCGTLYKPCRHCREIMNNISPDMVYKIIDKNLR